MRFTPIIAAGLAAPLATAAPTTRSDGAVSMMATAIPEWTIESANRACNADDSACVWSFGIQTNTGAASVPCSFTVNAADGKPASQTDAAGIACGAFTVSEGWSSQFGIENAFTTLSVADFASRLIAYPAYTDKELAGGAVVSPNRSYQAQNF